MKTKDIKQVVVASALIIIALVNFTQGNYNEGLITLVGAAIIVAMMEEYDAN